MTPSWILDIFAALMLVVAAVSAGRLVVAQPWRQGAQRAALADIDVAHLLMAIAMAGMLTASLQTLPNGAWEVIFAVLTAVVRLPGGTGPAGQRRPRAGRRALRTAPHPCRGDAVHVPRPSRPCGARIGDERHGRGRGHDGDPEPAVPGLYLRAAADRLQYLGPGSALRPRHQRALQPRGRPRRAGQRSAGRRHSGGRAGRCRHVRAGWRPPGRLAVATEPATASQVQPAGVDGPASGAGRGILAPWVATSSRIAMGVTMAFMLLILI